MANQELEEDRVAGRLEERRLENVRDGEGYIEMVSMSYFEESVYAYEGGMAEVVGNMFRILAWAFWRGKHIVKVVVMMMMMMERRIVTRLVMRQKKRMARRLTVKAPT